MAVYQRLHHMHAHIPELAEKSFLFKRNGSDSSYTDTYIFNENGKITVLRTGTSWSGEYSARPQNYTITAREAIAMTISEMTTNDDPTPENSSKWEEVSIALENYMNGIEESPFV